MLDIVKNKLIDDSWVEKSVGLYSAKLRIVAKLSQYSLIICNGYKRSDWVKVLLISKKDLLVEKELLIRLLFDLKRLELYPLYDNLSKRNFVDCGRFKNREFYTVSCFVNPNYPEGYNEENVLRSFY